MQDYPDWVYQGYLLKQKLIGEIGVQDYVIKQYPVPNSTLTTSIALLSLGLGFDSASKALIVIYILASFWALLKLSQHVAGFAHARALTIIASIFVSSSFWNGYIAYQLALLLLGLFVLESEYRKGPRARLIAPFGILLFFTHFIPYCIFLAWVVIVHTGRRRMRHLAALLPSLLLLGAYLVGRAMNGVGEAVNPPSEVPRGIAAHLAYKGYTLLKLGPFQGLLRPDGTSFLEGSNVAYWSFIGISAGFVGTVFLTGLWQGVRRLRNDARRVRRWALLLALLGLAFLAAPPSCFGVVNAGERVAVPVFLLLLVSTRFPKAVRAGLAVAALLFTFYQLTFLIDHVHVRPSDVAVVPLEDAYANTRQKYLSHRLFERAPYYLALEEGQTSLPIFPTGVLVRMGTGTLGSSHGISGPP